MSEFFTPPGRGQEVGPESESTKETSINDWVNSLTTKYRDGDRHPDITSRRDTLMREIQANTDESLTLNDSQIRLLDIEANKYIDQESNLALERIHLILSSE